MADDGRRVLVTGLVAASEEFPWPADAEPRARAEATRHAIEDCAGWTAANARSAWTAAGLGAGDAADAGCVAGTLYGGGAVSEYVSSTLAALGPRWLSPETYGYAAAHGGTGRVCIDLGLGGPGLMLVGRSAGLDAVGLARRGVTLGRSPVAVCGAFDWATPLTAVLLGDVGPGVGAGCRVAVFTVLESARHALARGARPVGEVLAWASAMLPQPGRAGGAMARVVKSAVAESGVPPADIRWWLATPSGPAVAAARAVAGQLGMAVSLVGEPPGCPSPAVAPLFDLRSQLERPQRRALAGEPYPASLLTSLADRFSALVRRPLAP